MKKLKIFMPLLVVILFSFNAFLQAMPSGCSDIEVSTSGGAPSDPKKKYVFKVEDFFSLEEMLELDIHRMMSLLYEGGFYAFIMSIPDRAKDNFVFGSVCNGAFWNEFFESFFIDPSNFFDYDKPYMVKRVFNCGSTNVRITTSCSRSYSYSPNCYSELVQITNGEETLDLFTFKANYHETNIADFGCYLGDGEPLLFLESNNKYNIIYDEGHQAGLYYFHDYFKGAKYIGSYGTNTEILDDDVSPWRKVLSKEEGEHLRKIFLSPNSCRFVPDQQPYRGANPDKLTPLNLHPFPVIAETVTGAKKKIVYDSSFEDIHELTLQLKESYKNNDE